MVEFRRHRRWLAVSGITMAAVLAVVLSARALDADDPCQAPSAAPPAETALMPAEMSFAQVFTLRDGKLARMEIYSERDEAVAAAGLSE